MALTPAVNYAQTPEYRTIPGNRPEAVSQLPAVGSLPAAQQLPLAIGLPLRNQDALTNLLKQLYDPTSARFHRWLTPGEFAEQFGPTKSDYARVVHFAQAHGLKVTYQHSNRLLLDVTGPIASLEEAFHARLRVYQHPTEHRTFYAPDGDLSVEADVPILHVSGLDNYSLPRPIGFRLTEQATNGGGVTPYNGSAPGGLYVGSDFRKAYAPGVTNTGAGQYIAIIDVGGPYYTNDVYMYETNAGLFPNVVVSNIFCTLTASWTNPLTTGTVNEGEEVLDIAMAMSMAPGATILNYEGGSDDVFNRIATDNLAKQMTLSYGFGLDANNYQAFQEFVAQGQAFCLASGDAGAQINGGDLTCNPWATSVGGTVLTMSGNGVAWSSETAWGGSGGGLSSYGLPDWQEGIATVANQASTLWRNYPDVAMPAVNIFTVYENGTIVGGTAGTSAASPLWAGFMALVNQQAAAAGKPPVGFINPAIYRLGLGPRSTYTNCFHDITTGNNFSSQVPSNYSATFGYDLCTGWGTPTGSNTINALAGVGTNDFTVSAAPTVFYLYPDAVGATTISAIPMNGFGGSIGLSISNLPGGVSAVFGTTNITGNTPGTVLTLTVANNAAIGNFAPVITAVSGGLEHSVTLDLFVGTNDFTLSAAPALFNLVRGGVATTRVSVIPTNGFGATVGLSISNLPGGVSAAFGSTSITNNTVLTLTVGNNAAVGSFAPVITAVSGSIKHSLSLNLGVAMPIPGATPVNLSSYYTRAGIYSDGLTFNGGLDNGGYAYSANLLGTSPVWNGVSFSVGAPNTFDTIVMQGQTIALPAGNYTSLLLLGTAVNGNQGSLTFKVTYTDGTTTNFAQSFSDWANPRRYPGEFIVANMPYRNSGGGGQDLGTPVNVYGYAFTLNPAKTVETITLPSDGNALLLAMTLANDVAPVSLTSYCNRAGIYTDGTIFTNGGLDGGNNAYSATLLGGSLTWSNTIFNFGPPNVTNVISAASQTITLPAGNFSALRMLGSAINGGQASQPFIMTYANGATTTFRQGLSDWFTLTAYSGQTIVSAMGYRDEGSGGADNRTFCLYGYSFNLNGTNPVRSLQLPSNGNVMILAISLVPHWPPVFAANPFSEPGVQAGQPCSGTIATNAVDLNGSGLTFAKASGPAWLSVAANGALSGTPLSPNVGANSFTVNATDPAGTATNATMTINVTPAPPIVSTLSLANGGVQLSWTGGIAPYQIQTATNLATPDWVDFGSLIDGNSILITPTNAAQFYQIDGQ